MNFLDALKNELTTNIDYNKSITENGAIGFKTSGNKILDMNFNVSSYRNESDEDIIKDFKLALAENPDVALVWLFFARDVRGGLGERRLFRICFKEYLKTSISNERIEKLLEILPEFGRYDDLIDILGISKKIDSMIFNIVKTQLTEDIKNMEEGKSISLLAKWLPSSGVKRQERRVQRSILVKGLGLTKKEYCKTLSKLRAYENVVEVDMSSNNWGDINYEQVPSRASLLYRNAFIKHDVERYTKYIESVNKGEAKINAGTLYPHDIVSQYTETDAWSSILTELNSSLEALWSNLPNTVEDNGKTIIVRDGSGSMTSGVGKGKLTCLEVATALAIYFSERLSGPYKNKFITFSAEPQLIDLSNCKTLHDKLEVTYGQDECSNTDIEKTFDLILDTAVNNKLTQEEIPQNVCIISDMEWDMAHGTYGAWYDGYHRVDDKALFEVIAKKYEDAGYKLPRLVFWNVCSRTKTIPLTQNKNGVALVSGFSVNTAKMVMSGELNPYKCLLETLDSERYEPIRNILEETKD